MALVGVGYGRPEASSCNHRCAGWHTWEPTAEATALAKSKSVRINGAQRLASNVGAQHTHTAVADWSHVEVVGRCTECAEHTHEKLAGKPNLYCEEPSGSEVATDMAHTFHTHDLQHSRGFAALDFVCGANSCACASHMLSHFTHLSIVHVQSHQRTTQRIKNDHTSGFLSIHLRLCGSSVRMLAPSFKDLRSKDSGDPIFVKPSANI